MFVSFDKAFKQKENQNIIPDTVLEYLNRQLDSPDLRYVSDENGHCVITSTNGKYKLSGIAFELPAEMKKILGETPSINDIQEYSYNSQKTIPIKLLEEGYIRLNGKKIRIENLNFDPFNEVHYVTGSLYAHPPKMDEKIEISISGSTEEILLKFRRIPDNSLDWIVFKSENGKPIHFLIKINKRENKMIYSISYDLKKVKNLKEAIKVADIYNAFASGEGKMNNIPITIDSGEKGEKEFTEEQILFWKKMMSLEEKIGTCLNPFSEDVTNLDIYTGEVLYRTLVCKTPVRIQENIVSIEGTGNIKTMKENFGIQKPIAFYFEDYSKAILFGTEVQLRSIKALYNCIISELQENDGTFKIVLKDESDEKQKYTVAMYFFSDEELEAYKQEHNIVEEFKDAKRAMEYLAFD